MTGVLAERALEGRRVCVAFDGCGLGDRLAELGAELTTWSEPAAAGEQAGERAVAAAASLADAPELLVVDAGAVLAVAGGEPVDLLRQALDSAFVVVRAIAHGCWIEPGTAGGKVVLVGPAPGAGTHSGALAAALENTARTLSVEWARFGIRVVAVLPRAGANEADIAELVAFLASDAGDYFSGCAIRPGEAPA